MMSDPNNNNNNSQINLANNSFPLQRSTTVTNGAINNNDTNIPIISQLNSIVSVTDNSNISNRQFLIVHVVYIHGSRDSIYIIYHVTKFIMKSINAHVSAHAQ